MADTEKNAMSNANELVSLRILAVPLKVEDPNFSLEVENEGDHCWLRSSWLGFGPHIGHAGSFSGGCR